MTNNPNTSDNWDFFAKDYSNSCGRPIPPTNIVEYPMCIMLLLSDAQHAGGIEQNSQANAMINGAKVMLSNMIRAARAQERGKASA